MMRPPAAAWMATSNSCRGMIAFQLGDQPLPLVEGILLVDDGRQRIHRLRR